MLSFIYKTAVFLHSKLTRCRHPEIPVISVGNISVGGTGKTPVVMKIIKDIGSLAPVAVVSRGYGRKTVRTLEVSSCDDYLVSGDEPLLIKRNSPEVLVIVAKNRYRGALLASGRGARVVILDDGLQSWEIKRDLNIVLVNALDPFAGEKLLPAGRLREPLSALNRANAIVITKSNYVSPSRLEEIKEKLDFYSPGTDIFIAREKIGSFRKLFGSKKCSPEYFRGKKVMCFSALGNNASFHKLLEQYGLDVIEKKEKRDHYKWKENEINKISEEARSRGLDLITTEKDAVKLFAFSPFECWFAGMETEIQNEKKWKEKIYEVIK